MNAIPKNGPLTILHVEDDDDYVFIFKESLEGELGDVAVQAASDGFEAMTALNQAVGQSSGRLPDLVLLDINMPRMNGFDFLRKKNEHPGLAAIPVVMLTASKREEDRRLAADLGADDFVCKEADLEEIIGTIRKHLRDAR